MIELSWTDVQDAAHACAARWDTSRPKLDAVYGIPRGGFIPAALVATELALPLVTEVGPRTLVVDDLVDSGRTAQTLAPRYFDALFRKPYAPLQWAPDADRLTDEWAAFPWEYEAGELGIEDAVARIAQRAGLDANGLDLHATEIVLVGALDRATNRVGGTAL